VIGITVAIDTNIAAVGFLGDKAIGAGAKGAHGVIKGASVNFKNDFIEGIGVVFHDRFREFNANTDFNHAILKFYRVFFREVLEPLGTNAARSKENFFAFSFLTFGVNNSVTDVVFDDEVFDFGISDELYVMFLEIFLERGDNIFEFVSADVLSSTNNEFNIFFFSLFD